MVHAYTLKSFYHRRCNDTRYSKVPAGGGVVVGVVGVVDVVVVVSVAVDVIVVVLVVINTVSPI